MLERCMRCPRIAEVKTGGLRVLCDQCALLTSPVICEDFHHYWHTLPEGKYVCLTCGTLMSSVVINTNIVHVPEKVEWVDC